MQKLPFETITKSISLNKSKWVKFKLWLKKQGKTFSQWVRERIDDEIDRQ